MGAQKRQMGKEHYGGRVSACTVKAVKGFWGSGTEYKLIQHIGGEEYVWVDDRACFEDKKNR